VRRLLFPSVFVVASCVPPDDGLTYGSVAFEVGATEGTRTGVVSRDRDRSFAADPYTLSFERVLLSFRTMTIGRIVAGDDKCSFRGRGESSDIVFDPRFGIVQTFNGVKIGDCPDVGIALDPPGAATEVGPGASAADLVELATGSPAHALVDVVARSRTKELRVRFRFEIATTSSKFGACVGTTRGVSVESGTRQTVDVRFGAETLFHPTLSSDSLALVAPFAEADTDLDGIVTMSEIDGLPITTLVAALPALPGEAYRDLEGRRRGTLGDWVREMFRRTFAYRETGGCYGNEPGVE
jgi:hypothetical protein